MLLQQESQQALLYEETEKDSHEEILNPRPLHANLGNRYVRNRSALAWFFGTLLIASNCFFVFMWHSATISCVRPKLISSPATSALHYHVETLWRDVDNNVFTGEPREELDDAWHELLAPLVIRVSGEELKPLGMPSLALNDGSGYIAEIAAFHELHCIKRIRRHLHLDRYYPNMTDFEKDFEKRHIDHCLEYLREAAMCRGDPTLSTFYWKRDTPTSTQQSTHECIDWDALAAWAMNRRVDASDYSVFSEDVVYPN